MYKSPRKNTSILSFLLALCLLPLPLTIITYHPPPPSILQPNSTWVRPIKRSGIKKILTHIPAPLRILFTVLLSSTTTPLSLSTRSSACMTRSKLDLAPFSCVKRAMAMFARRPRWRIVWNSTASEREGMWRAVRSGSAISKTPNHFREEMCRIKGKTYNSWHQPLPRLSQPLCRPRCPSYRTSSTL